MFIPNKTYHAIKVATVILIAALVMVIAGQFVLYVKMAGSNKVTLDSLQVRLDTLTTTTQLFDKGSLKKHTVTENQITDAVTAITGLETKVTELQASVENLNNSSDMLIRNECNVMPFYMEKALVTTCRNKGYPINK